MNLIKTLLFCLFAACLTVPTTGLAQSSAPSPSHSGSTTELTPQEKAQQQAQAAAASAACGGFFLIIMVVAVAVFVLHILILVWVARDARNRGMDSPVLWLLLIVFTGFIGLIVYIFSRPSGALAQCPHCGNKRLAVLASCPHCRNA